MNGNQERVLIKCAGCGKDEYSDVPQCGWCHREMRRPIGYGQPMPHGQQPMQPGYAPHIGRIFISRVMSITYVHSARIG